MRIRSIKPDIWRSDDFTSLDDFGQLMFIGLMNYVDDNGVGKYNVVDFAADVFASHLASDAYGTLQKITEVFGSLSERGMVQIYTAKISGKDVNLVYLTNWDKHQQISHPMKPRFPRPDADSKPLLKIAENCGNLPKTSARNRGTEEQRNRGTDIPPVVPQEGDGEENIQADEIHVEADAEFKQFWEVYPNHDYEEAAIRVFRKVRHRRQDRPSLTALIAGAQMLANSGTEPQFIPQAARWLRDGGWKNKPKPPRRAELPPVTSNAMYNAGFIHDLGQQPTQDDLQIEGIE